MESPSRGLVQCCHPFWRFGSKACSCCLVSHACPWVGSVKASWRNMRMNLLNSFLERLTMLKTNFAVNEQVSYSNFISCSYSPMELTHFSSSKSPEINSSWLPFPFLFFQLGLFLYIIILPAIRICGLKIQVRSDRAILLYVYALKMVVASMT